MATDLSAVAKSEGIKYFLVSFVDLFGVLRAKLVPARAIGGMQEEGAGFAGFAAWLDMTPADSDMFAVPDPESLIQLPWKPEVGWLAADLWMDGKEVEASPRIMLKRQIARAAAKGYRMKSGVECEYFLIDEAGSNIADPRDIQEKPCYDQARADAPLRCHQRDLRRHDRARLGPLPERPRGRQRPVRDELGLQRLPGHRGPPQLLQVHGEVDRGAARPARHLHAEALLPPHRQRLPRPCLGVGQGRGREPLLRRLRRDGGSRPSPIASSGGSSTTPRRCAPSSTPPSTATSASTPRPPPRGRAGRRMR